MFELLPITIHCEIMRWNPGGMYFVLCSLLTWDASVQEAICTFLLYCLWFLHLDKKACCIAIRQNHICSVAAIYLNLLKLLVSRLISTSNMFHTSLMKLLLGNLMAVCAWWWWWCGLLTDAFFFEVLGCVFFLMNFNFFLQVVGENS